MTVTQKGEGGKAEAQTGAGTATVCRVLSEKVNEEALPQDVVTGAALRNRTIQKAGERICVNHTDTSKPETKEEIAAGLLRASDAMYQLDNFRSPVLGTGHLHSPKMASKKPRC